MNYLKWSPKVRKIIITKNHDPIVKTKCCKNHQKKRPSLFGSDRDIIAISDDFDEPLDDFQDYI